MCGFTLINAFATKILYVTMVTTLELIEKSFTRAAGMMRDVMTPICVGHRYHFRFGVNLGKSKALSTIRKIKKKHLCVYVFRYS